MPGRFILNYPAGARHAAVADLPILGYAPSKFGSESRTTLAVVPPRHRLPLAEIDILGLRQRELSILACRSLADKSELEVVPSSGVDYTTLSTYCTTIYGTRGRVITPVPVSASYGARDELP